MEITAFLRPTRQFLSRRLWLIAVVLIVGLIGATVAAIAPTLADRPLNPDLVSAQRLRVNTTELQALDRTISAYHTPPTFPAITKNPWQTSP